MIFCKVFIVKDLRQITVIGLGLLGGSITLAVRRCFSTVRAVGYAHRASTRRRAQELSVATEVTGDLKVSVSQADIVIVATPIFTFEEIFGVIGKCARRGCIVTDVGSTKVLPHRWARGKLGKGIHYVGSHPIAGSEQRGVEYARDDLLCGTKCIVTSTKSTDADARAKLIEFWSVLGCHVDLMNPREHDRILGNVSHLPHVTAAALINASDSEELKYTGKGFMDTSRVASGPTNIWSDIILANSSNIARSIDRLVGELSKLSSAIKAENEKRVKQLLKSARDKRNELIKYKMRKKEIGS
jgi:prephenate dehydrogenase